MILTAKKVLELREKHGMIHGLAERELENPEGVGLEVRLGDAFKLSSDGFLYQDTRDTPDNKKVLEEGSEEVLTLEPGDYYLIKTREEVEVPSDAIEVEGTEAHIMPDVYPRSTLHRSGLIFKGTNTSPGYEGPLIFGLKNVSDQTFEIQEGARIAEMVFKQAVGGLVRDYEGQWQGGRVTTEEEEEQI